MTNRGIVGAAAPAGAPFGPASLDSLGSVPSSQLGNALKYDPRISAYNVNGSSLGFFRAALAKARGTTATPAVISCVGDSTTGGTGATSPRAVNSYPGLLRSLLNASGRFGIVSDGMGIPSSGQPPGGALDSRIVFSGSWFINGQTWGGYGAMYSGTGTDTITFTPVAPVDGFIIYIATQANAGHFTWAIDGGSTTTISPATTSGYQAFTVSAGTRGAHTLTVSGATTATFNQVLAIEPIDSTATLRIGNLGLSATNTAGWTAGSAGPATPSPFTGIYDMPVTSPALTILALGTNDDNAPATNAVPLSVYQANIRALVAKARSKNGDVLLVGLHPTSSNATDAVRAQYVQALYNVADLDNVALLDMSRRWPATWSAANVEPYAYMFDSLHPNSRGYSDWAAGVASILMSVV